MREQPKYLALPFFPLKGRPSNIQIPITLLWAQELDWGEVSKALAKGAKFKETPKNLVIKTSTSLMSYF